MPKDISISKDFEGMRVKNYLKKTIDVPNGALFKFIKNKRITLNKKKIKKDDVLKSGDIITIWLDSIPLRQQQKRFTQSKNMDLEVLYDTPDFFVLNKKPGVVVQGAQETSESLSLHLSYLKDKWKDNSDFEYFHVHRLDKETSGTLVIAKNQKSLRELNQLFREGKVEKTYYCLCDGEFEEKSGIIDVFLNRTPEGSKEKVEVVSAQAKQGSEKRTKSRYKVLEEYDVDNEVFSLVEVIIETGFMHQIRVHMKHIGHPILGDKMYGNSYLNKQYEEKISRQFLHASAIAFSYNNEKYEINAPLPYDLQSLLSFMEES